MWANVFHPKKDVEVSRLDFLNQIPLFHGLRPWELKSVAHIIHQRKYEESEYLFEQGQPGAALFIIESGEVCVELGLPDSPTYTKLVHLGPGSFLGELALLDQSPRSASARACTATHCYALFRKDLDSLVDTHASTGFKIYKALASIIGDRLKTSNTIISIKKAA